MSKLYRQITALEASLNDIKTVPLTELAGMVRDDWKKVNFAAVPYLDAMEAMGHDGMYGQDSWTSIVAYFLSNARSWTGPVAKEVKAELNRRFKTKKMNGS